MEFDWLAEAKRNLKSTDAAVTEKGLDNDEVLQELVIDVTSTILYSLVSIADSLRRLANNSDGKIFG